MLENLLIKFLGLCLASAGLLALRETYKRLQYFLQYASRFIDQVQLDDKVMLQGRIMQESSNFNLVSPLSQKYCVYWQVQIFRGNGKYTHLDRLLQSETPWRLTDTTSEIVVEIRQAEVELYQHIDFHDYQNIFRRFRYLKTTNFLAKVNYDYRHKNNITVVERTLKLQDKIMVCGKIISLHPPTIAGCKVFDSFFYQIYGIILSCLVGMIISYFGLGLII